MSFDIRTIPEFDQRVKTLAKKYASLKKDLLGLVVELAEEPRQGTSLGKGCFKVRMCFIPACRGGSHPRARGRAAAPG